MADSEDTNPATAEYGDADTDHNMASEASQTKEEVFLPGDEMDEGEELTMDSSAYEMYHAGQTGAPCLSFDVVRDQLGEDRTTYPVTCYLVTGSQAEQATASTVMVVKMTGLDKSSGDESDSDDGYIEDAAEGPTMLTASIKHPGGVNRIRCAHTPNRNVVSTWSDNGSVYVWDIAPLKDSVDSASAQKHCQLPNSQATPLFSFGGHRVEGFAMDWSPVDTSRLATGSNNSSIHVWQMSNAGSFHVDQRPYDAHTASVEDIQWSPNEANVFASCSADKTIRVWDARASGKAACMITTTAHASDVNVISWNRREPFLVSGGDDGVIHVWDLRQLPSGQSVATFKHHTAPITSVEWHASDASVFAAAGADDQVTLWDLAVEHDTEKRQASDNPKLDDLPPQLLFIHMGQQEIKEVHWHPQIPGTLLSTAHSGFNIFKTISV